MSWTDCAGTSREVAGPACGKRFFLRDKAWPLAGSIDGQYTARQSFLAPWTRTAEKLRDFVLETEQEATLLEEQLLERHGGSNRSRRKSPARSKRTPARDGSRRVR